MVLRARAGAGVVGAALATLVLVTPARAARPGQSPSPDLRTIVEIRVHGNQSMSSDAVLALAGVALGARVEAGIEATVRQRLLDSGKFDEVDVRTRYLSLSVTDEIALVLVVRERPGADVTNPVARLLGPVLRRALVFPVLDYVEGDGVTYGGRVAFVEVAGADGRLSIPATWGGRKQIGIELDKSFAEGQARVRSGVALESSENAHFEIDDERVTVWAAAGRQLPADLHVDGQVGWADVTFGRLTDRLVSYRVSLAYDSRRAVSFPRDAVYASASYEWLDAASVGSVIGRPRFDVQVFAGLVGQAVLALRGHFTGADGPLPPFEQTLFGGPTGGRGWRVGALVGDRLALASAEIRLPFTSMFSLGDAGLKIFYDTGTVFDVGDSIRDVRFRQGAGLGVFMKPPFVDVGVDVAHNLVGGVRVHVVASLAF